MQDQQLEGSRPLRYLGSDVARPGRRMGQIPVSELFWRIRNPANVFRKLRKALHRRGQKSPASAPVHVWHLNFPWCILP